MEKPKTIELPNKFRYWLLVNGLSFLTHFLIYIIKNILHFTKCVHNEMKIKLGLRCKSISLALFKQPIGLLKETFS